MTIVVCPNCFRDIQVNEIESVKYCNDCKMDFATSLDVDALNQLESKLYKRVKHLQKNLDRLNEEVVPSLNMQIESSLKRNIKLEKFCYESSRTIKADKYVIEGFLKDGLRSIETHAIAMMNKYFSADHPLDSIGVAINKESNIKYFIINTNVYNQGQPSNDEVWVLMVNLMGVPLIINKSSFERDYDIKMNEPKNE